jgi:hypothetical protein
MFLWAEGVQGAEIHTHLCAVYKWIEICKKVRKSVTDAQRMEHLSTSTSDEKLEEARAIV